MYQLNIPKMNCGSCANKIKNALLELDDEAAVSFDVSKREILIETDASIDDVINTLSVIGYPAN
ncbi:MAG TPA: heavy-metal-associated domain-containing protein [Methylotenera sp.]